MGWGVSHLAPEDKPGMEVGTTNHQARWGRGYRTNPRKSASHWSNVFLAPPEGGLELVFFFARALRKQSKCGVIHEGEGHWPKLSQKLQKARHLWVARTPQKQSKGRRASVARDMRNTKFHWQRSKFAFQRAGRLLSCPRAMRGPGRAGTPSSSAEWQ